MAIKTLRVFAEYTSTGFVPMPIAGGIDYGYTLANTFPSATPSSFQTDDPDIDVTVTAMTDFYVWIRINGTAWNPSYTRNVRVYPDSPDINNVVMNMIIATGPAGTSAYSQIVQTSNRLYFNGATTDSVYNSKFAGKTYINELNFGTAPQLATVATSGAYADLTGKPALSTVATSGSYADLSNKPSGTAPISYNSGTNSFQISVASASTNGYLTSTDWTTFNNKFSTPTGDTTQYVTGNGTLATFPVLASADKLVMVVRNTSGATITKGTVVYINGASGNKPTIAKALANADSTSAQTLGLVQSDIGNNSNGNVTIVGSITDLDTSAFTDGTQLYLSGTTAGAYTSTKTLAPTHLVYVGVVSRAHPTQGTIEVKVQNGYELDEIHDVQISSPANKDILYRDSATSLWKHASIASVLGYTPYNATNPNNYIALTALSASAPLSYNNTTGAFSITQANTTTNGFLSSIDWNTFNSKQSALTLGNVSEVNSNVLSFPDGGTGKTIGNLSIQVIQAGASTNGYLSSTDWTTFNNKQNALGFTPIQYSSLSASAPLAYNNTTGAFSITQATTSTNGYLSSTDWNTFNSKQNVITLTTTGTSGAATFSTNTLNIPQYQSALTNPVTGVSTSGYVTFWNGNSTISGDSAYFWNNTNKRLGINTSSPSSQIHIAGASDNIFSDGIRISRLSTLGQYISVNYSGGSANIVATDTVGSNPIITFNNSVNGSSTSERMRITSAGNVGIGTTSIDYLLTLGTSTGDAVASTTSLAITTNNQYGLSSAKKLLNLNFVGHVGTIKAQIQSWDETGDTGNGTLVFNTRSGSTLGERMRITSDGNVGIGMTPTAKFHVVLPSFTNEDTDSQQAVFGSGTNGNGIRIGYSQTSNYGVINALRPGVAWSNLYLQTGGGNVILGTYTNAGYKFYVAGAIYATGNITANSDLNLKKNLKLVDNPIDKLNQLNGYLYQWKENDEYQYGVIAQEVEKILPHAVSTGKDGIKGVSYNQLIPVMIEAIKELNKKLEAK
jgi:hypothetical protein